MINIAPPVLGEVEREHWQFKQAGTEAGPMPITPRPCTDYLFQFIRPDVFN